MHVRPKKLRKSRKNAPLTKAFKDGCAALFLSFRFFSKLLFLGGVHSIFAELPATPELDEAGGSQVCGVEDLELFHVNLVEMSCKSVLE